MPLGRELRCSLPAQRAVSAGPRRASWMVCAGTAARAFSGMTAYTRDAGHAIFLGYPYTEHDMPDRFVSSGDDSQCDADVDNRADCKRPGRDDRSTA